MSAELIERLKAVAGDGFAYLASPYSRYPAGMEAANEAICRAAAWCLKNGIHVFAPICHSHCIAVIGGIDQMDHDIWLPADAPLMRAANGIIVVQMPTWDTSYGVSFEMREFAEAGKPQEFLPWPLPEVDRG